MSKGIGAKSATLQSQVNSGDFCDNELLQKASGGLVFRGVFLTDYIEDCLRERDFLLKVPRNIKLTKDSKSEDKIKTFSSLYQENNFKRNVNTLGYSFAESSGIPAFPLSASTDRDSQKEAFMSTIKCSTLQLAKYTITKEDMKLSDHARRDLNEILMMLATKGPESSDVEAACKRFFSTYGSHVYEGPIRFGGHFWWTCSSSNFSPEEMRFIKEMQSKIISAASRATCVSDSAPATIQQIKDSYQGQCLNSTLSSTHLDIEVTGGLPKATTFSQWKKVLLSSNRTWVVADRGTKLLAVWELIQENHEKELGALKTLLKNTWIKITSNIILPDCTLGNVLKTEALQNKPQALDSILFESNSNAHTLLDKLGLLKYYPKKLQLQDALCIRSDPLELSLGMSSSTDPKELPYLILHKIMAYDYRCRSDLMHSSNDKSAFSDSFSDSGSDQSNDVDSDDDNARSSDTLDDNNIHPVDGLFAVILCSDDFLCQDLLSRLAKCQLAVPFIIPDPFTKQLFIPLWAMRSIIKDFTSNGKPQVCPIIQHKMPIVSFICIGKHTPQCTPRILNQVISDSRHNHFFHHDCPGAQYDIILGQGLVDVCWYLPAGKQTDTFPYPVTFLNLHGDARDHLEQTKFLSQISSMCFLLLTEKVKFDKEMLEILKKFSSCPCGITVLNEGGETPSSLKKKVCNIRKLNLAAIKDLVKQRITKKHDSESIFQSIEECCCTKDSCIIVDEKCDTNIKKAQELASEVVEKMACKKECIPLQALWREWADYNREASRQTRRGDKTVNDYTAEIQAKKKNIREELKIAALLTPLMESFIVSLLKLGGPSNRILRNHFLQFLKLDFHIISQNKVSAKQSQYLEAREKLEELQRSVNAKSDDIRESIKLSKEETQGHQQEIADASFGLEHLFRELGQIYVAAKMSSENISYLDISRLSTAAAELFIDGYPMELMDGEASHVPLTWVAAVLKETARMLNNPKVYVLSILGLQSTGKSTMLNTVFGLQFNVSAGRCTRGAFMQLLPVDEKLREQTGFSYVLVVDTEGLRAPELSRLVSQKHDNELATFVIGLANKTLINIYGEVPGDLDDILQTAVHAFIRMRQVKHKPSCQFVHQNVDDSKNKEVGHGNFIDKLNEVTVNAARAENLYDFETFNDVIRFDRKKDILFYFPGLWDQWHMSIVITALLLNH